jgi:hypothetical protein
VSKLTAAELIAMIVDRDTPPDLDGDEVIDWDMTGKPITRRMVNDWAKARAAANGTGDKA